MQDGLNPSDLLLIGLILISLLIRLGVRFKCSGRCHRLTVLICPLFFLQKLHRSMAYTMKRTKREKDFFLVQRAICGDQAAYTEIYTSYYKFVKYAVSKVLTKFPMDVDDVCMEAFERAFALLHRFQPNYQLSAWLVRIGVNRALDYLRKNSDVYVVSVDTADDDSEQCTTIQIMCKDPLPFENVERDQDIVYLRERMNRLSQDEQDVLCMKCLDGLSSDEVAEQMGVTRRIVRHTVRDGIQHLKELVDKKDIKIRNTM